MYVYILEHEYIYVKYLLGDEYIYVSMLIQYTYTVAFLYICIYVYV